MKKTIAFLAAVLLAMPFQAKDKEEIIKRLVSLEFHRFIEYYQDDEDFEAESEPQSRRDKRHVDVKLSEGYDKLFINVGKMDGVGPKELLGMINGCIRHEVEVGRIDLFTRYSLFDVKSESAQEVIDELSTLKLHGRAIRVTPATEEQINRGKQKARPERPSVHPAGRRERKDRRAGKERKN